MCIAISRTPAVRFVDAPDEVIYEHGHTGFLHFHSAVIALIFLARRIPPFLSLVDCGVERGARMI